MIIRAAHALAGVELDALVIMHLFGVSSLGAQAVSDAGCVRLLDRLVGRWEVVSTTFGQVTDPPPVFVAEATADGRAVHSVFRQQLGDTQYEAVALWACSVEHADVRVFEVNTLGLVAMYVGNFDGSGTLRAELRDSQGQIQQRRTMEWIGPDTLAMSGSYRADGADELQVTMVRFVRE